MSHRAIALSLTLAILAIPGFAVILPGSALAAAPSPNIPFSWNPKVPCKPLVVRITDITANQTGSASFGASPFSPGTTSPVSGGDSKRWLTPGATPPGWMAPGPSCTVTNSKGTKSVFVEIDGLQRNSLTNEDWSELYDPANGGTPHSTLTGDTTFNLFDPTVVPDYSTSCSSASDPTCYGRIHAEIDHDWKAAGYCGTGTVCDNATLASQTSPTSSLIDVQGFVYWDSGAIAADWHQFNGWEIHPLTGWKLDSSPPPVPFRISVLPDNPQVGQPVAFTATAWYETVPASFSWDFGDGVTASGSSVSHIFVAPQVFTVYATMSSVNGTLFTTWTVVPVGSWNQNVACAPLLMTLESVLGSISIQRISSNPDSTGADYSGGGFQLDGSLPYGSNPSTWPFFRRDLRPPCNVNGTSAFVEFHNATVINVSHTENCGTTYQNATSYPNGWQSCDVTFTLATPGWGDDFCPACYMHRLYAGIDRDWNASGIAPMPPPLEGQRIDVQGFVFWNDANVNATWHSFSGWELHPISAWELTHLPIIASFSYSPSNPNSAQTVVFNATGSGGGGPYTFNWDFGDGTVASGSTTNHTYAPGTYAVHLSVIDSLGTVGTTAQNVTVDYPPDFSMSINPSSIAFPAGSSISTTLNVSSVHGFSGNVSLTTLVAPGLIGAINPSSVTPASDGSAVSTLSFSSLTPGVYAVSVTGSSGLLSHSASVNVNVVDVGPTVAFSESTNSAFRNQAITMTITSSDIDGNVTGIRVDWGDGTIDNLPGNSVTDVHAYVSAGSFSINVSATDNAGLSSSAAAVNTITDAPPIAEFTQSIATAPTGTLISYNGSTSSDPDGTIVAYSWDFGDGSTASGPDGTHSYSLAGDYTVTLMVTDNATLTASDTSTVHVTDRPPTVSFTASTTSSPTGIPIILAISAIDPDGTVSQVQVSWGDGTIDMLPGDATTNSHSYILAGSYTVNLTAIDNAGLTSSSQAAIEVTDRPPVVSLATSAGTVPTGTMVIIVISATDSDGTIRAINVSWGDGTVDSLLGDVTGDRHSYTTSGLYGLYVKATDDADLTTQSNMASLMITDRPPVISFSESARTAFRDQTLIMNISSSDPDGTVASLRVDWGDGTIDVLPGISNTDNHAYALAGTFTVNVTAMDNEGVSASVGAVNTILDSPPTVSLTITPTNTDTGRAVTLTVSSQDSDGTIAQTVVNWGDGTIHTFAGAATTDTHSYTHTGNAESEIFAVSVTVTDDATLEGMSSEVVVINDVPPTSSFTSSTTSALTGDSVGFNAAASSDADGSIAIYSWQFGDGSTGTGAVVSHAYSESGVYVVALTVTDNSGSKASVSLTETILDRPPLATAISSSPTSLTMAGVGFNATDSFDPDGTIVGYAWNFGDGSTASGYAVVHSYAKAGNYTVVLAVTDNNGSVSFDSVLLVVLDQAPTASFTYTPTDPLAGQVISCDASSSSDPDGTVASFYWSFGDGTVDTGATVQHAYAANGTYTLSLTTTDDDGTVGTSITIVAVGYDTAPTWSAGGSISTVRIDAHRVTVSWTGATDRVRVSSYTLYMNGTLVTGLSGSVSSYTMTGLNPLTYYVFQVQAGNPSGNHSSDGPSTMAFTRLQGDVNLDCQVDIVDLAMVGSSFGRNLGDSTYNPRADLNGDGVIDVVDLAIVGSNFGQGC